jgi:sec-independent protein translocase protein TatA
MQEEGMLAVGPLGFGPVELILVLTIVVILFGVGRLSEVGGAIGRGIRQFRKEIRQPNDLDARPDQRS